MSWMILTAVAFLQVRTVVILSDRHETEVFCFSGDACNAKIAMIKTRVALSLGASGLSRLSRRCFCGRIYLASWLEGSARGMAIEVSGFCSALVWKPQHLLLWAVLCIHVHQYRAFHASISTVLCNAVLSQGQGRLPTTSMASESSTLNPQISPASTEPCCRVSIPPPRRCRRS